MYGPVHANYIAGDVHHNLVTGLASPWVSGCYIAGTLLFMLHLRHGLLSTLQSLGFARRVQQRLQPWLSATLLLCTLGFLAPPLAALCGYWD
jgi:hypothetical protein